jgi:hypothetical protein
LPPSTPIGGRSQAEWQAIWWQWGLGAPAGQSAIQDGNPQTGDFGPVFLLAGAFGPDGTASRQVTVGPGQILFFPLVNGLTTELDSAYGQPNPTEADLRLDVSEFVGVGSNLFVELDGVPLASPADLLANHRFQSTLFDLVVTAGDTANAFGYPPGILTSVSDGYWVALAGLEPGTYTLRFGGTATSTGIYEGVFDPNVQNITYAVTVTPEPASLLAFGGLAVVGAVVTRRRTRT